MKKQFSPSTIAIGGVIIVALVVSVFFATQNGLQKNRDYDESKFLSYAYILSAKDIDFFVMKTREDYLETIWREYSSYPVRVQGFYMQEGDESSSAEDWLVFDETIEPTPGGRYIFPLPKVEVQGAFTFSAAPVDDEGHAVEQAEAGELPQTLSLSTFLFDEDELEPVPSTPNSIFDAIDQQIANENRLRKQGVEKAPAQKVNVGMKQVDPESTCIDRNGKQIPCSTESPPVVSTQEEFSIFFPRDNDQLLIDFGVEIPLQGDVDYDNIYNSLDDYLQQQSHEGSLRFWDAAAKQTRLPIVENPKEAPPGVLEFLKEALVIS